MLIGMNDGSYTGYYRSLVETQNRGVLWNGQRPRELYDLWNNIGFIDDPNGAQFRKRLNDQVRFSAFGSADIGDHAVSVGVEYEQYAQRRYDLAPVGLWTRGRALANSHLVWVDTVAVGSYNVPGSTLPFVLSDRIGSGVHHFRPQLAHRAWFGPQRR